MYLQWNGTTPGLQVVGHITFNGGVEKTADDFRSVDVTTFIKDASSTVKTFMIVRSPHELDTVCATSRVSMFTAMDHFNALACAGRVHAQH